MAKLTKKQEQLLVANPTLIHSVEEMVMRYLPEDQEGFSITDIACAMVADFGNRALSCAKSYHACLYGVPFEKIDPAIRQDYSITYPPRVRALLNSALTIYMKSGSTRIEYLELMKYVRYSERRAGAKDIPVPPVIIMAAIIDSDPRFEIITNADGRVWISEGAAAAAESRIATSVLKLNRRGGIKVSSEELEGNMLSIEQRNAVFESMNRGISVITGPGGTGKTKVAETMCLIAEHHCRPVVLLAPTNVAADNLRARTGRPAATIHKELGIIPCQKIRSLKSLPENSFVIVDEASMIDCRIYDALLDSVCKTPGANVVLMGDDSQLPSVGPGAVLRDLIASKIVHTSELSRVFRCDLKTDLYQAVTSIRRREVFYPKKENKDHTFIIKKMHLGLSLVDDVVACFRAVKNKYPSLPTTEIRILCPVRAQRFDVTVKKLNEAIHDAYYMDSPAYETNGYKISVGEPIVIESNHPDLDLFNGYMVEVIGIDDGITVKYGDRIVNLSPKILAKMRLQLGYATTVHKAQSKEAAIVIIVLPDDEKLKGMLTNNLIYVAASRARKKCIIISQGDAYEQAVKNAGKPRITGLQDKLMGGNKGV